MNQTLRVRVTHVSLAVWFLAPALGLPALTPQASAQPIVVFGDSLSDTGNILALSQSPQGVLLGFTPRPTSPWYAPGQFTNGPTGNAGLPATQFTQGAWVNVLADRLGRPRPVAAGLAADVAPLGTNYAWGGALAADDTLLLGVATQVGLYVAGRTRVPSNAIHTFWLGGNDLINAARAPGATPAQVAAAGTAALSAVRASIQGLVSVLDPAQPANIIWANMPALDRTPAALTLPAQLRTALAQASLSFRTAQLEAIEQLRAARPTLNLVSLDVYTLFGQVLDTPGAFGITNTTTPILSTTDFTLPGPFNPTRNVPLGTSPDTHAFWDDLHPTSRMHALIGEQAALIIPAPHAAAPLALGLLIATRRRRAA
jgi:phospholipase/lecithinase/hemolysin